MKTKLQRRERWLATYESQLRAQFPDQYIQIDWDTAIFMFNRGDDATAAAFHTAGRIKETQ